MGYKSKIEADKNSELQKFKDYLKKNKISYPTKYPKTQKISKIIKNWKIDQKYQIVGRISAMRLMGSIIFLKLSLDGYTCQLSMSKSATTDYGRAKKLLRRGDIVYCSGVGWKSKNNSWAILVKTWNLLAKSMGQIPEKWAGVKNLELRAKKRYLDLLSSDKRVLHFKKIACINRSIREYLWANEYIEFDIPTIEAEFGGADAKPFKTFVNGKKKYYYLNVAHELKLKQLLIGGFSRIFALKSCFRNQDLDSTHNPEFNMLECYTASYTYMDTMKLVESIIARIISDYDGNMVRKIVTKFGTHLVDFNVWAVEKFYDLFEKNKIDITKDSAELYEKYVAGLQPKILKDFKSKDAILMKIFDLHIESTLIQPTHVINYPTCSTSLAKKSTRGNWLQRCESYVGGVEIANMYSEQNNPVAQITAMGSEMKNSEFCNAIKYSFVPNGGLGLGVTRIAMLLAGVKSIKDVILHPL